MNETQLHQAISTAANLHAMLSSRMVNAVGFMHHEGHTTQWADDEEHLAFIAACRLLNKRWNDCYECLCNETDEPS